MAATHPALRLWHAFQTLEKRAPRPAKPEPQDEDAYWRGVSHGFHTALVWAEEVSRGARDYGAVYHASSLITFLDWVDEFTRLWGSDESPHVFFEDDGPAP